jgi:hypothetical protein
LVLPHKEVSVSALREQVTRFLVLSKMYFRSPALRFEIRTSQ